MPPPSTERTPLGPQIGIEAVDLGSNDPPFSLTLEQLTNRCNLVQRVASTQYEEARPWLAEHAYALLPPEVDETIARFPPLAAKASLVVLALPPERQIEFLRGLLKPATLAAAAAAPDVFTIATMVQAIVEGGHSDPALQATLASCLMTEEACKTLAATTTVPQLANASRAVSLQADPDTKERLMRALLIEAYPPPAPEETVSNAHLAEAASLITNADDCSELVTRYLSDQTCDELARQGGHIEIGSIAFAASFLQNTERLSQVADRLFTDRALKTLVNAATSGLPRGHQAIGRAAKLVDSLPAGDLKTELAGRIATPEVCVALEASGDLTAIGRMAMASVAVSNVDRLTQAMGALASHDTCDRLIAHPDPVAIGQLLYASAHWYKQEGSLGLNAIDSLLQGDPLKALHSWPDPVDTFRALPAATLLPDPARRHATLAQLMRPEIMAAVPDSQVDVIAWAARHAQQMQPGPERDASLGALLTSTSCETVLASRAAEGIKAVKKAAALLPEGAQRQQVLAIMDGQQPKQWALLAAGQRTPPQKSRGAAAGAEP